jgi:signal transduction histidine kinase
VSLRARITLFGLLVVLLVLACFGGGMFALAATALPGSQDKDLTQRAQRATAQVLTAPPADFAPTHPLAPLDPATDNDVFLVVLDSDGSVLSHTGGTTPQLPPALLDKARAAGGTSATVTVDGVRVRVRVEPFHRADRDGFVVAAQPLRRRVSDLAGIAVVLVVSSIGTLIAAACAIWLVTRRALRPLRQLTEAADEVGRAPDRTRRLSLGGRGDDLGRVAASFNAMLDRLEQAHARTATMLAAQQRFTADASHELRTPLTTIRANAGFLRANPTAAEADRAAALGDIEAEAARMSRLVDDLLTLARADGGGQPAAAPVDLGRLAHEVCRRAASQHPDRDIHCSGPPTPLRADADALSQLLWILLDNAVRHTAPGDAIWVAVTAPAPGRAILQVADAGEGIPAGQERRIFDRFHQADPARRHGGAGLGLSIAQWVARAHRGGITAANNERGGASFTVTLSSLS